MITFSFAIRPPDDMNFYPQIYLNQNHFVKFKIPFLVISQLPVPSVGRVPAFAGAHLRRPAFAEAATRRQAEVAPTPLD
jgi:hypothetical protein